jgi:hypothetical protein
METHMKKPKIGSKWRFLAHGPQYRVEIGSKDCHQALIVAIEPETIFDELVVDQWFHMEQMDKNTWWMRLGEKNVMVCIDKNGKAEIGEWYE